MNDKTVERKPVRFAAARDVLGVVVMVLIVTPFVIAAVGAFLLVASLLLGR